MTKGILPECPKCGGKEVSVEYDKQAVLSFANGRDAELKQIGNDKLLNTCDRCGYKQFTSPLDSKE